MACETPAHAHTARVVGWKQRMVARFGAAVWRICYQYLVIISDVVAATLATVVTEPLRPCALGEFVLLVSLSNVRFV